MAKKKLIGVIIDSMDGAYEKRISENLSRSALDKDLTLLFFVGSEGASVLNEEQRFQTIFDLANPTQLDGVILVPVSMSGRLQEATKALAVKYSDKLPMVSIARPMDNAYNVVLDNRGAMEEVIGHMESHCPIEEMGFIGGPADNIEAQERKEAFEARLLSLGLSPEDHCFEGDFLRASGQMAVDWFIEKRGHLPKVLIAANDEMAFGALTRLATLGINVPQEVAVTGFDNIDLSKEYFPPMTTYDPFINNICSKALKGILGMIESREEARTLVTKGKLIVRESCGCHMDRIEEPYRSLALSEEEPDDYGEAILRLKTLLSNPKVLADFEILLRKTTMPSPESAIDFHRLGHLMFESILKDLSNRKIAGDFIGSVKNLVNNSVMAGGNPDLSKLTYGLPGFFLSKTSHEGLKSEMMAIFEMSQKIVNKGVHAQEKNLLRQVRDLYKRSRKVVLDLNDSMSREEIYQVLQDSLNSYGISQCYMVLYKRPIDYKGSTTFLYPMTAELVFGYKEGHRLKEQSFMTQNILPTEIMFEGQGKSLMFLSLSSSNSYFGYIAFTVDALDSLIYETVRGQVSEALKRQQMNIKRLEAERALNNVLRELELSNELLTRQSIMDEMSGLYNRRGFYSKAEAYFNEAIKSQEAFWIIFGDIDGLKQINDLYGHTEGDYAITKIGHVLKETLPDSAIVARVSGDEFTALIKKQEQGQVIQAYVAGIEERLIRLNQEIEKPYTLSISLGYAPYDYQQLHTMDDLLRKADTNLYRAKERKKKV